LLSSSGSPRIGFSRSSSRLSFQDDLEDDDFSCPFEVDDVDTSDSYARYLYLPQIFSCDKMAGIISVYLTNILFSCGYFQYEHLCYVGCMFSLDLLGKAL
jgi:hypothetical protein